MKYTALLEALSLQQIRYVDSKLGGKKYEPYYSHRELFESYPSRYHRITIPFNPDAHITVDKTIRGHLARHGYNVHDYTTGLASKQYVEKPIGRVAIKKYISNEKVNGKQHIIYRAESRAFGNPPD